MVHVILTMEDGESETKAATNEVEEPLAKALATVSFLVNRILFHPL